MTKGGGRCLPEDHMVCSRKEEEEQREGGEGRRGCGLKHVAVETESSDGQCEVRGVILGADCS